MTDTCNRPTKSSHSCRWAEPPRSPASHRDPRGRWAARPLYRRQAVESLEQTGAVRNRTAHQAQWAPRPRGWRPCSIGSFRSRSRTRRWHAQPRWAPRHSAECGSAVPMSAAAVSSATGGGRDARYTATPLSRLVEFTGAKTRLSAETRSFFHLTATTTRARTR
jgi:hypothetical protein